MSDGSSSGGARLWALGLAALAAFAVGVWRSGNEPGTAAPSAQAETAPAPEASTVRDLAAASDPSRAPDHTIPEGGRLRLKKSELPSEGVLHFALGLGDEARGDSPREVRIGAQDGREIRTKAAHGEGAGAGLRIDIPARWLRPGPYLIEVKTAEQVPLPLERYALIVEP